MHDPVHAMEMIPQMPFSCSVAIATRNRKEDLRRTCQALRQLSPPPFEVMIAADACTDGTPEMVREAFPEFRLLVSMRSRGSIGARDEMIRNAQGDLVLTLDDDSYPVEPDFLARVQTFFAANPRLAVLTFPQRSDEFPETLGQQDFGPSELAGTYTSSGAVIRKSVYIQLGGYPAFFHHAYEEPDFALRCVAAGCEVRRETSLTVRHHFTGVQRNEIRTHQFHARNEFWSAIMRCPAPQVFVVAKFRALRQLGYACKRGPGWVLREPLWWLRAIAGIPRCLRQRHPLPWRQYRRWMQLVRHPVALPNTTGDAGPGSSSGN